MGVLKKERQRHNFESETESYSERKTLAEAETVIEKGTPWLTETKTEWEKERREDKCLNWQLIPQILAGF